MCGIAGVLARGGPPPRIEVLARMGAALQHRGPDGAGVYRDRTCGLAHTRLAIVDLDGGAQPMCDDANNAVLAFNGELFNFIELRAELRDQGVELRTRSDTEVVLHALRTWGVDALARFDGQFALALWRPREGELLLARDRFGERPLYVTEHRGQVLFASEIKALFAADPELPRALDPDGLVETFTFWTVVPPRTPFCGIEELRPGCVRSYTPGGTREHAYWEPRFAETFTGTIDDAASALRDELARAVELRLTRADVPVGCYLSGGLDSGVVAALASRVHGAGLKTFSLRFADAEYDERAAQQAMVERLATDHRERVITRADIAAVFPRVIRHVERPLLRTAAAPMFLLAELVREAGLRVVLTGEGADELLAGYDLFREARIRRFWAREPGSRRRPRLLDRLHPYLARSPAAACSMAHAFFRLGLERPDAPDFAHGPRWRSAAALQRLFAPAVLEAATDPIARLVATFPADFARWEPLARDQYVEIRTLLSGYLLSAQGDRVAMASAIEGRYPFLAPGVVALACRLPAEHKLRVLDEKHVLKRLATDLVPPAVARRVKQPFRAPDALAFVADSRPRWIDEALERDAVVEAGMFDPDSVARLWTKCRAARAQLSNSDNMALVGVLSTQLLHAELVRGPAAPRPSRAPRVIDRLAEEPR